MDLGMKVRVREHKDDGSPESTWPPIAGARVRFVDAGTKVNDFTTRPAITDASGLAIVDAIKFSVEADGFAPYEGVYLHPNLGAELPVSLRRL